MRIQEYQFMKILCMDIEIHDFWPDIWNRQFSGVPPQECQNFVRSTAWCGPYISSLSCLNFKSTLSASPRCCTWELDSEVTIPQTIDRLFPKMWVWVSFSTMPAFILVSFSHTELDSTGKFPISAAEYPQFVGHPHAASASPRHFM